MMTGTTLRLVFSVSNLFISLAAIARRVYLRPGTGIGALRKAFGSKKDNGVRRGHFAVVCH